jgi:RNA polymerase sigma-70 factor (ECF subfamily)
MQSLAQIPTGGDPLRGSERALVSEVLHKDRKATAEFISRCSDWLYPFLSRRLMPRTEMVEDLMQEILLAAWQNLANFRGEAGLRAWILGIARHKIEDYYRKRIRQAVSQDDEDCSVEEKVTPQFEEQLDAAAQQQRIQQTLARLPEGYMLVLLWRYRDDKSVREMAELTGKTEKAVERLLARARAAFKKRWDYAQS